MPVHGVIHMIQEMNCVGRYSCCRFDGSTVQGYDCRSLSRRDHLAYLPAGILAQYVVFLVL